MRDRYTGDQRDPIKWGAIVDLAHRSPKTARILHVQMLREEVEPAVLVDGEERLIHDGVWSVLSDTTLQNERLSAAVEGLKIESWAQPFTHAARAAYFEHLCEHIRAIDANRIVLLDPDTGIEPASGAKAEHVRAGEIGAVWEALGGRDWLAIYQHGRRDQAWERHARRAFSDCCHGAAVTVYRGKQPLAQDVAILAARK